MIQTRYVCLEKVNIAIQLYSTISNISSFDILLNWSRSEQGKVSSLENYAFLVTTNGSLSVAVTQLSVFNCRLESNICA